MDQTSEKNAGSKMTRTKDVLTVASMTVTVLGAVGTVFVWLAANFFVGDLEIVTTKPYQNIDVDVYDMKGQKTSFQTPTMQLMPGKYHLAISADNQPKHHVEATVQLRKKTTVPVALEEPVAASPPIPSEHRHWWQFWKGDGGQEEPPNQETDSNQPNK